MPHPALSRPSLATDRTDVSCPSSEPDSVAGHSDGPWAISVDGTIHAGTADRSGKLELRYRTARPVESVFAVGIAGMVRPKFEFLSDLIEQRR